MRLTGEVADANFPDNCDLFQRISDAILRTTGFANKYVGERDVSGFRSGYGTFTFSDGSKNMHGLGSVYTGQWWGGLRHGFG